MSSDACTNRFFMSVCTAKKMSDGSLEMYLLMLCGAIWFGVNITKRSPTSANPAEGQNKKIWRIDVHVPDLLDELVKCESRWMETGDYTRACVRIRSQIPCNNHHEIWDWTTRAAANRCIHKI